MGTMIDERVVTERDIETSNDKPESAHIVVSPDPAESHHAYVMRARFEGFPIEALCGFTWIPNKQATGLPVCQECKEIWDSLPDDGEGWVRE